MGVETAESSVILLRHIVQSVTLVVTESGNKGKWRTKKEIVVLVTMLEWVKDGGEMTRSVGILFRCII